jgi:3-hydroxyacyl-[acyl-carrier-protein] dehydratase
VTFTLPLGREQIEQLLPHRPPFLLIDEVVELEPGLRAVALKHVLAEDWWFPGHFPGRPVMPGVLTMEAIAQTGAVVALSDERYAGKLVFFAGIDKCRFKRVVEPGETLTLECELVKLRGPVGRGRGTARVGDELAAEANLSFFVGAE